MAMLGSGSGNRTWVLKILADVADATKGFDTVEKGASTLGDKAKTIGKSVVAALGTAAVVSFAKDAVLMASDLEQSIGGARSVFGDFSGEIEAFGKDSAKNLGVSNEEFLRMSTLTGSLLKGAGIPLDQVAESTMTLSQRASDLAATYGGTAADAMGAMSSALKGEFDPLEKFGVSLRASDIEARAMAQGYVDASGKVTKAGKALAAQELILEQSTDAAGAYAKESGSLAGQQQTLAAEFKNMQATLGQQLLPVIVKVMDVVRPLITFIGQNMSWLAPMAGILLGIATAMWVVNSATSAWSVATTIWSGVTKIATGLQWLFNAAMSANPIGLIVAAIAAVIAIVVLLYTKVDWFRAGVDAAIDGVVAAWNWLWGILETVFAWVRDNWPLLLTILTGPIGAAVAIIVENWDTIKNAAIGVFNWVKNNWPTLLAILTGPFGLAVLAIVRNWDTIKSFFTGLPGQIRGWLTQVGEILSYPFRRGADLAVRGFDSVMTFFRNLPYNIGRMFSGLADAISAPFKYAFDSVKRLWNSTVGGFGFTVPSWVPGVGGKGWTIPRMALGGIVTRPTIALIGEAGPEAVIPLNGSNTPGMGSVVTINVYALTASAEVGRQVFDSLREYQRVSGKAI